MPLGVLLPFFRRKPARRPAVVRFYRTVERGDSDCQLLLSCNRLTAERARYWRENIVNLSRRELAERIGISASRITDYERGHDRGSGVPIDQGTMTRYRLACAAVALGVEFDWLTLSHLTPLGQVRITMPAGDSGDRGD